MSDFNSGFKKDEDPISKRFGPNTQPMRRHTMAYSMVDSEEARKRHGGTAAGMLADTPVGLAPTELMQAVVPTAPIVINTQETTSIKTIVSLLIEKDIAAWQALPQEVRDMMLANPASFTIVPNKLPGGIPYISYAGVELRWNGAECWMLVTIRNK